MGDISTQRQMLRCAIYTRKSSEEGLEQAFNSLDAQRAACEAYVLSQHHEGWRLLPHVYDDGGFSGGDMQRPALKALLDEVRAGRIDTVIVYKIDRLTRSLADFARIVEVLDAKNASFVSVTQAFNTTTSMGRLTLNVLLSFAQFEREITGERIRDKIAASKAKGMWMGGYRPLGYQIIERGLVPHPAEAPVIVELFQRFLEVESVDSLLKNAARGGLIDKLERRSAKPMGRGALYDLLQNPIYIGEVRHKEKRYPGLHKGIVERPVFDQVQAALAGRRRKRAAGERALTPALLTGLLFSASGQRYTPTHTTTRGRRYVYYCLMDQTAAATNDRLPGRQTESAIIQGLIEALQDAATIGPHLAAISSADILSLLSRAERCATALKAPIASERRAAFRDLVQKAVVKGDRITIALRTKALLDDNTRDPIELDLPFKVVRRGAELKLMVAPGGGAPPTPDPILVSLIAKGCKWLEELTSGTAPTRLAIADREGVTPAYVGQLVEMAFLAPDLKTAILQGTHPPQLTGRLLHQLCPLPLDWEDQRRLVLKACRAA